MTAALAKPFASKIKGLDPAVAPPGTAALASKYMSNSRSTNTPNMNTSNSLSSQPPISRGTFLGG